MTQLNAVSLASDPMVCIQKLAYTNDATINKIADALGGPNAFCNLPFLNWKNDFQGRTGYIDGVQSKDLSHSIMRGVDPHGRSFVAIRTETRKSCEETSLGVGVETFFQRFSNRADPWVNGQDYERYPLLASGTVNDAVIEKLRNLNAGNPVEFIRWDDEIFIKKLS